MFAFFKYFAYASFVALFAIIFQAYFESSQLQRVTKVLTDLVKLEKFERTEIPRIAVGYGSCSDLIIHAVEFLNYSESYKDFQKRDENDDEINNYEEFIKSFMYYFSKGAAAERYMKNAEEFSNLVQLAKKHSSHRWELGGNAPIMATRLLFEKTEVLLAATMSEKQKTHLIHGIDLVDFTPSAEFVDDIHLILEYKTGERFGDHVAPRANRYILHSDGNNPNLKSLDLLTIERLKAFKPNLFIVSGLHMLDNYPFRDISIRSQRLAKVKEQMTAIDKSTLTHFEMASYVEIELMNDIVKYVLPYSDSLGCNEQEINNLMNVLEHGRVGIVANSNPRLATTLDEMRKVFKIHNSNYFENRDKDPNLRMLSRIHIHTLGFQLIMNVKDSKWKRIKNAVARASLMAHNHVCQTYYVNPENAMLILDDSFATSAEPQETEDVRPKRINMAKSNRGVSCWSETIYVSSNPVEVKICIAPVLVCKVAKKTVGAGDNISAVGLGVQL